MMPVAEGPNSGSSIVTGLSTPPPSPPPRAALEPNSQTHCDEVPEEKSENQAESTGNVTDILTRLPESPPLSSRRVGPQAKADQSDSKLPHGATTVPLPPQIEVPEIVIHPHTSEDAPLSRWQSSASASVDPLHIEKQLVPNCFPKCRSALQPSGNKAETALSKPPGGRSLRPHELMSGRRPLPIYGPFTGPNCPQGCRPPLNPDPDSLSLQDCWFYTEKEVPRRASRGRNGPHVRQRTRRLLYPPFVKQSAPNQVNGGSASAGGLVHPHNMDMEAPPRTQETVEDAGSNGTGSRAQKGNMRHAVRVVTSTFAAFGRFVASSVRDYFHDRDARAGELGSHSTQTAHWLQRARLQSPEAERKRDYRTSSIPYYVEREQW